MSSKAVRSWFRTKLVTPGVDGVPFVETVNRTPDERTLPAAWCTIEFNGATESRLTLGGVAVFREVGQVNIIVVGKSGKGDSVVLAAAEQFRTLFTGTREMTGSGYLYIDAPEPPNTDPTESGNWFLASVTCPYVYDVTR